MARECGRQITLNRTCGRKRLSVSFLLWHDKSENTATDWIESSNVYVWDGMIVTVNAETNNIVYIVCNLLDSWTTTIQKVHQLCSLDSVVVIASDRGEKETFRTEINFSNTWKNFVFSFRIKKKLCIDRFVCCSKFLF